MEGKAEERYGEGYLEERKLVPRWPAPIPQIVNTIFILAIFYVTWWIFQDPRGWLRLYTPYVGYMYTRWILIVLIWMVYLYHYWPFRRHQLDNWHPVVKGLVMSAVMFVVLMVLIKGFFEGILGNLAMAYFSPAQTTKLPGMSLPE